MRLIDVHFSILNCALIMLLLGCSQKASIPYQRTGEVVFIAQKNPETITLRSTAYASDDVTASRYAEVNAFENLLFKGIPGSNQRQPLIPNEEEARRKHNDLLDYLLQQKYNEYILERSISYTEASNNDKLQDIILDIDLGALRKYLEREGVIRSFGF